MKHRVQTWWMFQAFVNLSFFVRSAWFPVSEFLSWTDNHLSTWSLQGIQDTLETFAGLVPTYYGNSSRSLCHGQKSWKLTESAYWA